MKQKVIAAFLTVMALLGPIAMAVDLGDYPSFLFEKGNLDAYVVVGTGAAGADAAGLASDVAGAIDIAVRLAGESYTEVSTSGGSTVSGGESQDLDLGDRLNDTDNFGNTLEDDDLAGLQDTQVTIDIGSVDNDYDVHDEIRLGNNAGSPVTALIAVDTALTGAVATVDEDWKDNIVLASKSGSMGYYYVFDDTIVAGNYIANATEDDPITLDFLGKTLEITSATATSLTAQVGDEVSLNAGDSVTVGSKAVKLENVGSGGSVLVSVDGVTATIGADSSKTVNGVEVKNKDTFYSDTFSERQAVLIVGVDATKTYSDGDEYIGQDEDDPDWVWDLAGLNGASPRLGILWDQNKDDPEDGAPMLGGSDPCYRFPNDFAKVCLDKVATTDYQTYEFKDSTEELFDEGGSVTLSSSASVVLLKSMGGTKDGFKLTVGSTTYESDQVAIQVNNSGSGGSGVNVYYKDHENGNKFKKALNNVTSSSALKLNFQDAQPTLTVTTTNLAGTSQLKMNLTLESDTGDDVLFYFEESSATSSGFTYVGHSDSDTTQANDLLYGDTAGAERDLSGYEEDVRTGDGVVLLDPDSNSPSDAYKLKLPADYGTDFEVTVVAYGPGTTATSGTGGKVKQVVPVTSAVAKLDTEVPAPASVGKDLVLVGGPAVNRLTAQVMGLTFPHYGGQGGLPYAEGEGYVSYHANGFATGQDVVTVQGWSAENTRAAASVLQQFASFASKLDGKTAVKVTGSATSPVVSGA